jgi:hypothetical protein
MSGTSSSSNASSSSSSNMTIDIRPMIEDISQVMTKHITNILSGVIGEYNVYKETHDTIMGLPCVRKLQERIAELEDGGTSSSSATTVPHNQDTSREDEIIQLQSAIADLNRYIHALESKVDMKSVSGVVATTTVTDEESVKLEICEEDEAQDKDDENTEEEDIVSSTVKNVIITTTDAMTCEAEEAEEAEEIGRAHV